MTVESPHLHDEENGQEVSELQFSHERGCRARKATIGVVWSAFDTLIPALSGMLVFFLVTRVITPNELGVVALSATIVGIVSAFGPAGYSDAIVQRDRIAERHLDAAFWLCIISSIVIYIIIVAVSGPLSRFFSEPDLVYTLPVVGFRVIFDLGNVVPAALLMRTMQFRQIAIRTFIASSVSAAICITVLFAGYGFWSLIVSQVISSAAVCVVSWRAVTWRPRLKAMPAALGDLSQIGLYASGSRLITTINVDQIVIGSLMGSAALGLFAFARRIFQMFNDVFAGALASVSYPLLSSLQKEDAKLRDAFVATTFLSAVISFPLFTGLALVAPDLIHLVFGDKWDASVPALQAFCAIGFLSCIGILQASLIRAKGRAAWWMWYQAAQQVLTGLVIWLFSDTGIVGVVVGIAIKTWAIWPLSALLAAKLVGLRKFQYLRQFGSPLASCGFMAAGVLAVDHVFGVVGLNGLVVKVAFGAALYTLFIVGLARNRIRQILALLKPDASVPAKQPGSDL